MHELGLFSRRSVRFALYTLRKKPVIPLKLREGISMGFRTEQFIVRETIAKG